MERIERVESGEWREMRVESGEWREMRVESGGWRVTRPKMVLTGFTGLTRSFCFQ